MANLLQQIHAYLSILKWGSAIEIAIAIAINTNDHDLNENSMTWRDVSWLNF